MLVRSRRSRAALLAMVPAALLAFATPASAMGWVRIDGASLNGTRVEVTFAYACEWYEKFAVSVGVSQEGSGMGDSPEVPTTCDGKLHTLTLTVTHHYASRGNGFKAGEATITGQLRPTALNSEPSPIDETRTITLR